MKKQTRDDMVLSVQQWLNETYGNVSGYDKVTENGNTGWSTIYSLREGLQHELGITSIGSGFGEATENALSSVISSLKVGYTGNIAKLIQGAFWCKGISPTYFNNKITSETIDAVVEMQTDAGLEGDGVITVPFMKALFDMMAFTLVAGGDEHVRSIQQTLNRNYNAYFGILPADGIYQRETNTALIYALQVEIGLAGVANGVYGPGTIAATPTIMPGDSGNIVKIIQWGLYVNGFNEKADFSGSFNDYTAEQVIAFRKFMNLPQFTSTADLTVIKGLLTSNGNTNRDSIACDTSTQLTADDVSLLSRYGFSVVGRYLTGTVGTGDNKRDKNLTLSEIKRITDGGLSIFPIYQDGGWDQEYFTSDQGRTDAIRAHQAALKLGFPEGTTIYFAVDVDILDGDIDGTVIPYIKAVSDNLFKYEVGIYGTRNICTRAIEAGYAERCFVSNMSTGYSGNLGFKMPKEWAFDQFIEYSIGNLGIDQVASSGRDKATNSFDDNSKVIAADFAKDVVNSFSQFQAMFMGIDFETDVKFEHHDPLADYIVEYKNELTAIDKRNLATIDIDNGITASDWKEMLDTYDEVTGFFDIKDLETAFNKAAPVINDGAINISPVIINGYIGLKFIVNKSYKNGDDVLENMSVILQFAMHSGGFGTRPEDYVPVQNFFKLPDVDWENIMETIPDALAAVVGIVVLGVVIVNLPDEVVATGIAGLFTFISTKISTFN